jgi:hypothetical protein
MMNPSQILTVESITVESFLSELGGLIAAQEDLTIAEIIGGLEITKAELLESLFEPDEDEA